MQWSPSRSVPLVGARPPDAAAFRAAAAVPPQKCGRRGSRLGGRRRPACSAARVTASSSVPGAVCASRGGRRGRRVRRRGDRVFMVHLEVVVAVEAMAGRRRAHRPAEWTRAHPIGRSWARPPGRCTAPRTGLRLGLWSDATGCRRWDSGSPPSSRSGSGGSRPSRARARSPRSPSPLMAAALLWRRRAPLPALVAMCVIYAAWVLVDTPAGSLMPFVILLAGVFAAAQRGRRGGRSPAGSPGSRPSGSRSR